MKLAECSAGLKRSGDKALVAFFTAGYPDEATFLNLVRSAARAGSDIVEIGIPFSDPIADGPAVQESSRVALENGMTLARALELVAGLRQEISTPLVVMSYYNPILRFGLQRFADAASGAGVRGLIVPDLSFEESSEVRSIVRTQDVEYIDLIAPTSSDARMAKIGFVARGFTYLVSVTGVTGDRSPRAEDLATFTTRVRKHTSMPAYLGFGISDAATATTAVRFADGVVIGSALIRIVKDAHTRGEAVERVAAFLREVKQAIRGMNA